MSIGSLFKKYSLYALASLYVTCNTYTEELLDQKKIIPEESAAATTVTDTSPMPPVEKTDEKPASPQAAREKLEQVIRQSDKAFVVIKNTIIQVTMLLQKYGKNVERRTDAVKELQEASTQLEGFMQVQFKNIAHYNQQDPNTWPPEAYQEIYVVFDAILKKSDRLLEAVKKHIETNFKEPLDTSFFVTKGADLLDDELRNPDVLLKNCEAIINNAQAVYMAGTTIGLTRWNKVARVINHYFIQPCARYHLLEVGGIGLFAALASTYIYWKSNCKPHKTKSDKTQIKHSEVSTKSLEGSENGGLRAVDLTFEKFESEEKTKNWFTRFLQKYLGLYPAQNGVLLTLEDAVDVTYNGKVIVTAKTWWNQAVTALHNAVVNDPINSLIHSAVGYLVTSYGLKLMIPYFKHSLANWWQRSLGGASAEIAPVGTWEFEPDITLEHVIGLNQIKERLLPAIAYAENPEMYAQTVSAIPTNYVLYGLRRTGKSFFAKAIAGEMKKRNPRIKTLNVPCDAFRELGVQQTIDLIRSYAPCIAFVDEVDLGNFSRALDRRTTGELLKALGEGNISPDPSRPVFLIFATNKLEAIDTSLAALGRFGASILFTNPSFIDRLQFIFAKLQSVGLDPREFDIKKLAEKTEGNSLEEIAYCITLAKQKAIAHNEPITTDQIMMSLNEILHGIYPEFPHELHKEAIAVLSAHFAGKALITALTESNEILDTVSICRRKLPLIEDENASFSGKPTRQPKYNYGIILTRQETVTENNAGPAISRSWYMRILAGVIAEEMILGRTTNQCHVETYNNDSILLAYQNALRECADGGISYYFAKQMGDAQKTKYFAKAEALIEGYKQEVRMLLEQNRQALDVIIKALKFFGTLDDRTVLSIIENPTEVGERIDMFEKQREEEYKRRMEEQQAAAAA